MKNDKTQLLPKSPIKFIFVIAKKYWKWGLFAMLAVILARGFQTGLFYITKLLIDTINAVQDLEIKNYSEVWKWFFVFLGISLGTQVFWRASGFTGMRFVTFTRSEVYRRLFDYLMGHGMEYFINRFAGNLTNKVSHAAEGIDRILPKCLWNFLPTFVNIIVVTVLTFLENKFLGTSFVFWIVVFLGINFFLVRKTNVLAQKHARTSSELKGQMVDVTSNIGAVHQYAKRNIEFKNLKGFIQRREDTGLAEWMYSECILVINGVLQMILMTIMFGGSIYLWSQGKITVGAVVMIITLTWQILNDIFFIGMEMNGMAQDYGEIKEGLDEIIINYDVEDVPEAKALKVKSGQINFLDVHFHYPKGKYVFKDLNLQIQPGQKV